MHCLILTLLGNSPLARLRRCGVPGFAIILKKEHGKGSKKTPHDKNYGSHPERRSGSRERTGTVPSLIIERFFNFCRNWAFFLIGFGNINTRNHQC